MMLRTVTVALLLALEAGSVSADSVWLGVRGGTSVPAGNFDEIADTGWDVGGTAVWMYSRRSGLGVDVARHDWGGGPHWKAEAVGGPGSSFDLSALQVTAHYLRIVATETSISPWIKLGAGTYVSKVRVEGGQVESNNRKQSFGVNVGIGANCPIGSGWEMAMGVTYHHFQRMKIPPPEPGSPFFPDEDTGNAEPTGVYTIEATLAWGNR